MTRVYADMVADLFHHGHVEFLRRARALGDELLVGVHSDATVESYKRKPILNEDERLRVVEGCRHVDEVVGDAPLVVTREWIDRHGIDLVAHGDDFDATAMATFYPAPLDMGILRAVPYTPGISTTDIMARIERRLAEDLANGGG